MYKEQRKAVSKQTTFRQQGPNDNIQKAWQNVYLQHDRLMQQERRYKKMNMRGA